jgi:hypothetical protein
MRRKTRQGWSLALCSLVLTLCASPSWADEHAEQEQRELVLKGNELWGHYCSNCHNAPPAADRAPHEWDIIALHMRTRANLPAEHAKAIFAYLRSH